MEKLRIIIQAYINTYSYVLYALNMNVNINMLVDIVRHVSGVYST